MQRANTLRGRGRGKGTCNMLIFLFLNPSVLVSSSTTIVGGIALGGLLD